MDSLPQGGRGVSASREPNGTGAIERHPTETDVAICRQNAGSAHRKAERAVDLLRIRAFSDAQRELRSAANDLLAAADVLEAA